MTQRDQILEYLRDGNCLTPLEALNRFRCMRLSPRILELREAGYRINKTMVLVPSGKRVASYRLASGAQAPS